MKDATIDRIAYWIAYPWLKFCYDPSWTIGVVYIAAWVIFVWSLAY